MHKKIFFLFLRLTITITGILLFVYPAASQLNPAQSSDSLRRISTDSILPNLVVKIAKYTSTIDRTNFIIERNFNIDPYLKDFPAIEAKVNAFKSRVDENGSKMNLRSLNSGMIMLSEIADKLAAEEAVLQNYSARLTQSNKDIKAILHDPVINIHPADSVLQDQLDDIQTEGTALDSLQQNKLEDVNILRNKVSIILLRATDVISDMGYLQASLKLGIWDRQEPPLFTAKPAEYKNTLPVIISEAMTRSGKIILIYLNGKWNILTMVFLLFIGLLIWSKLNLKKLKSHAASGRVLGALHLLPRSVILSNLVALFTTLPFFFTTPPMSFIHLCELLRMLTIAYLIYPFLTTTARPLWIALCLLWLCYALDDILLESTYGERWGLLVLGILLGLVCLRILFNKKPNFISLAESPVTKPLVILTLLQVVLSIVFNLTGRVTLAKILGECAVQTLMTGISLKVLCTLFLEAVYVQSEAYQDSRFSEFINFKAFQPRFMRMLWILAAILWSLTLLRNLTIFEDVMQLLSSFINQVRTIGNMVFTFRSVVIFIGIIWISSVISGVLNFFLDYRKPDSTVKQSRLGSVMLLIRLTIWTLGFLIAVAAAGIPLDRLSFMIGALGVGIGFGLQNIFNNLVSGVILAFERPIQIGDLIEVGGKTGTVNEIGVRASRINNSEGAEIIVPNGDLISQQLINWTKQNRSKLISFNIGIPYDTSIETVEGIILEILPKNKRILHKPPPKVMVDQFGLIGIEMKVLFWIPEVTEAASIKSEIMMTVHDKLIAAGIKIPNQAVVSEEKPKG